MTYENNILTKITLVLNKEDLQTARKSLTGLLSVTDYISSYIVYAKYVNKQLISWRIECVVSQTSKYNCITVDTAICEICKILNDSVNETELIVIGWRQPPLAILVEILEPLTNKLSIQQAKAWEYLEYDDLCQICRISICNLYNKGYYVHKNLIRRAFFNDVYMLCRKKRREPLMRSLDELVNSKAGSEQDGILTFADITADEFAEDMAYRFEEQEAKDDVLQKKRAIIVEQIGQRQYDQLIREYGNKLTTEYSRKTVYKLKEYLKSIGIDSNSFNHLI